MFLFYLTQRRFILEITQKLSHKQKSPHEEAGSLNITAPSDKISNSLNAEGIGKNEISNTFQQDLKKQKTPQKEGLLNEDSSVARDRIELPTQGFSVALNSTVV